MADEKFDEKATEKQREKSVEEKWSRDPLSAIVWAGILIWAGLVFLAANLGWLDALVAQSDLPGALANLEAWPIVLIGAGLIILLEVVIRLLVPAYRRPVTGSLIFGIILIGLGLGDLIDWSILFPVILIAVGLSVLLRGFRSKEPEDL